MKNKFTSFLAVLLSTAALSAVSDMAAAQATASPAASTPAKPVSKASSKPAATPAKKKPAPSASRVEIKSTAKNLAAGIEAAEAALTPEELAIAERVHVGNLPCELGASVTLAGDEKVPGYFNVQVKNLKYRMFPVATSTGAIRLEDRKAGAVWLQLANKSMLMNQKLGIRLADECMSPAQVAVAQALKLNPPASVLDAPKPAAMPVAADMPVVVDMPAAPAMEPASVAR